MMIERGMQEVRADVREQVARTQTTVRRAVIEPGQQRGIGRTGPDPFSTSKRHGRASSGGGLAAEAGNGSNRTQEMGVDFEPEAGSMSAPPIVYSTSVANAESPLRPSNSTPKGAAMVETQGAVISGTMFGQNYAEPRVGPTWGRQPSVLIDDSPTTTIGRISTPPAFGKGH